MISTSNRYVAWALVKIGVPVVFETGGIRFYCPNHLAMWRADTFFEKEPETLQWIDSMRPGAFFVDIGASTGIYSLYAARRRIFSYAIEMDSDNYAIIYKNVFLNGFYGSYLNAINDDGRNASNYLYHADYVKIDVAGPEADVLTANERLFRNADQIQVEEYTDNREEISKIMKSWGFKCIKSSVSEMVLKTHSDYRNVLWERI